VGASEIMLKPSTCRIPVAHAAVAIILLLATTCLAFAASPTPTPSVQPKKGIAPRAEKLLTEVCQTLASADAFTFHAEILFDHVLPPDVKVQFAGAMDFAVQRPNELAIEYHSDLGAKQLWYHGDSLTVLDIPHMLYASATVPDTIDAMMQHMAATYHLTVPLGDFALSDPCKPFRRDILYGGYIGVNDVNGVATDHVAFSSAKEDLQLWLARNGKPIPLKVVINYRTEPGSPEYIATLSQWKFPKQIPASQFVAKTPKDAKRIEFMQVKEVKP
jgi:hypothetical protein